MPLWLIVIIVISALSLLWCFTIYKNSDSSGMFGRSFDIAAIVIILIVTIIVIFGILAGKFLL